MHSYKISWSKNDNEKLKNSSYLIYHIFSLGKMVGKPFPWRYIEYELLVKYLKDLAIEKTCCYFEWC